METIGLIPASGLAQRLGQLPCSKEILPVYLNINTRKPKVLSEYLLHSYRKANITRVYFIIRKGKWDIPNYFGDGSNLNMNIGYLLMNLPYGVPFTFDQAYSFVKNKYVAIGFPDIIFTPEDAYEKLVKKINFSKADIVLGIFPINDYLRSDMVELDNKGEINNIIIKQNRPDLKYGWTIAIWGPAFTEYLHLYLQKHLKTSPNGKVIEENNQSRELYIGDVIHSAIKDGLTIESVIFDTGTSKDMGTPEDLSGFQRDL
ncbi:MAG: hypothetical protein JXJ22_12710 [Bacteroidales bacterium]|nr:hypothetical protein [Bacteroidales bacterium]